jgi:hypothetical protein
VKESPHPLIPVEAGIQSLRKMPSELGPRFRGDDRVETSHVPSAVFFTGSKTGVDALMVASKTDVRRFGR